MKLKKTTPSTTPGPKPTADTMNPVSVLKREFDSMVKRFSPDETDQDNLNLLWAYFLGGSAQASAQIAHNAALPLSRAANEELKKVAAEPEPVATL
jgi:hypothetical protein